MPIFADPGLGVAITSYSGRLAIGLNGDPRAMDDMDVLVAGIDRSLHELELELAPPDTTNAVTRRRRLMRPPAWRPGRW